LVQLDCDCIVLQCSNASSIPTQAFAEVEGNNCIQLRSEQ